MHLLDRPGFLPALLQELGLPVGADIPMLGFIGRLDYQKGVDLIRDNFEWMMGEGVQLILLGSGRDDLEQSLRWAAGLDGALSLRQAVA